MTDSPAAMPAWALRLTISSVSKKYCRRSEWPTITCEHPASRSMKAATSQVNAPSFCSAAQFCAATLTFEPSRRSATLFKAVKTGASTISQRFAFATSGFKATAVATESVTVLYIFQFPAMTGLRMATTGTRLSTCFSYSILESRRYFIMLACFSYSIMILLCLTQIAHAQHFSIRRYGGSEGLGNNHVNCIFQDSKGYLWFGTWEGYVNMMKDPSLARSVPRFMVNDPRSHTKQHQSFLVCFVDRFTNWTSEKPQDGTTLSVSASTPGNFLPARNSSVAPPPVEM